MNLDIANWLFVFLRVSAVVMIFPVFSAKNIPARVRVALGALTAFLIAPGLPPFAVEIRLKTTSSPRSRQFSQAATSGTRYAQADWWP